MTEDRVTSWYVGETPNEARQQWHTEARERDEAYLALGPIDDTESEDSPWRGPINGHYEDCAYIRSLRSYDGEEPCDCGDRDE